MPRTLTMFFPHGRTEYWLTPLVFQAGDKLDRYGATWIVTSVGSHERDGERRHTTIMLRAQSDGDRFHPPVSQVSPYRLTFEPPDFIEQAAADERWTASDRSHCERMLRVAFEQALHVERLQRTALFVMAYRSAYVNWENAALDSEEDKPVLRALELLLKKLRRQLKPPEPSSSEYSVHFDE